MTDTAGAPNFNGIMQIAYTVPDLKAAMADWTGRLKVGPWFVSEHFSGTEKVYRGAPTDVDMTIGMTYWNQMNIELIQQLNDVPSVYRDLVERRGHGFHHWGVATADFDGELERYRAQGYEVAFSTRVRVTRLAYLDTSAQLPGMVELIEATQANKDAFTAMYRATIGWDGRDPVRPR
jgi:hypothetical protein